MSYCNVCRADDCERSLPHTSKERYSGIEENQSKMPEWIYESGYNNADQVIRMRNALAIALLSLRWVEDESKGLEEAQKEARDALRRIEVLGKCVVKHDIHLRCEGCDK